MGVSEQIHASLTEAFAPSRLVVTDESHLHAGHAGHSGSGESHFHVSIAAPAFAGLGRLARHRAVHAALGPELLGRIHALGLEISA